MSASIDSAMWYPATFQPLLTRISASLRSRGKKICIAETATGGLLSATLLSVPGASSYYGGGLTLYTLPSRVAFAGWTQENIENYKGPSEEVVRVLARNVREKLGADFCLAESGTAGPTGGDVGSNREVGSTFLAISSSTGEVSKFVKVGKGSDRAQNMMEFTRSALEFFADYLDSEEK